MKISSYNLRFDSMPDNITVANSIASLSDPLAEPDYLNTNLEAPWSTRRIRVAENLLNKSPVLLGLQEALVRQVNDLADLFGDDWGWIGVGRDDGVAAGEFCPIFYYKPTITLLSNDSFWLSDMPFEPSKFPGAGSFRICTVGRFTLHENNANKNVTLFTTHLDDQSDDERQLAASLLLYRARYEAVTTNGPVFVLGDFNSPETGSDSGAYNIITGAQTPVAINTTFAAKYAVNDTDFPDFKMVDLRSQAPRQRVSTNFATFTGFTDPDDTSGWTRIDFIFGGNNGKWTANSYHVDTSLQDDGILNSDHRPTFAEITLL